GLSAVVDDQHGRFGRDTDSIAGFHKGVHVLGGVLVAVSHRARQGINDNQLDGLVVPSPQVLGRLNDALRILAAGAEIDSGAHDCERNVVGEIVRLAEGGDAVVQTGVPFAGNVKD